MSHDSDRPFLHPEVQTMPQEQLRALQSERLREAVERAYKAGGFFYRRMRDHGVSPSDVASVDDLRALPTFRKEDLRANEAEYPPIGDYRVVGLAGSVRMATSSGTTGRPTVTIWTEHDLTIDYDIAARRYWREGVRPGHVIANAHPGYLNGGQAQLAGAAERMGCLPVSIGPPEDDALVERALRTIENIPIDHWHTMPAGAARIREVAERIGWPGRLPEVEAVTPMRQYSAISAGLECMGTLGGSCSPQDYRGAHVAEDYAVVEAVDDVTGEPVPDGERGKFLCTSLGRDNPMLRFDLNEVVRLDRSPCPCGETHVRAFWEGRMQDVVTVQGKWIMPIDVWFEMGEAQEFVVVRTADAQDALEVRVEDPADGLVERLRARTGVPVVVTPVPGGSLPRAAYKANRVVDERT